VALSGEKSLFFFDKTVAIHKNLSQSHIEAKKEDCQKNGAF
jgi:hypothetical protein